MTGVLLLLILIGFAAAPFAAAAAAGERGLRARVATAALLASTTATIGFAAFALDCGFMRPWSWMICGSLVASGVSVCAYFSIVHRLRFPLVCGAALVLTILALHFFGLGVSGVCQRACGGLRKGMTAEQAKASVLSRLPELEKYRVIDREGFLPPSGLGAFGFELRPNYTNLNGERITLWFDSQRFVGMTLSAVRFPEYFSPPVVGASMALCVVCLWRLWRKQIAPDLVSQNIVGRLKAVRAEACARYIPRKGGGMYRRALICFAGKRLQRLAYFSGREGEPGEAVTAPKSPSGSFGYHPRSG